MSCGAEPSTRDKTYPSAPITVDFLFDPFGLCTGHTGRKSGWAIRAKYTICAPAGTAGGGDLDPLPPPPEG